LSRVSLKLHDYTIDAAKVHEYIGLEPTKVWKKGDRVSERAINTQISSGSKFDFPIEENNVAITIERNILPLASALQELRRLDRSIYMEIGIVIYKRDGEGTPAVFFPADMLRVLADVPIDLDIDII
jgi:hypothetical protein